MFQIIDDDDHVLPVGQVGNIAIRTSPNRPVGLFKGYEVHCHNILDCVVACLFRVGNLFLPNITSNIMSLRAMQYLYNVSYLPQQCSIEHEIPN